MLGRITTEQTRYGHVVATLPPSVAMDIRDILLRPDPTLPYSRLKDALLARTAVSSRERLQQLLSGEELGDRRPSAMLRHMQQLLGTEAPVDGDPIFRQLFLSRLPQNVQAIVACAADTATLEQLAAMADKIVETTPQTGLSVSAVDNSLVAALSALTARVDALTTEKRDRGRQQGRDRSRSRNRSRSKSRRPSHYNQTGDTTYCWYHDTFGDKAKKCVPPCSYAGNDQASSQ